MRRLSKIPSGETGITTSNTSVNNNSSVSTAVNMRLASRCNKNSGQNQGGSIFVQTEDDSESSGSSLCSDADRPSITPRRSSRSVSYTHLTLPTNYSV